MEVITIVRAVCSGVSSMGEYCNYEDQFEIDEHASESDIQEVLFQDGWSLANNRWYCPSCS